MQPSKMRIGVDIGGVIIGGDKDDTSFFSEDYLKTPDVKDAVDALIALRFGVQLFLISKAGPKTARKTLDWFDSRAEFDPIERDKIIFVRERRQKAPVAKLLELDFFIDDRQDIVSSMEDVGVTGILFTSWADTFSKLFPDDWDASFV